MNFAELTEKVKSATLGSNRMTDIAAGKYTVAINGADVFLVSEKKEKVPVTVNGLAALRIVESKDKAITVKNTREARESTDYTTLQKAIADEKVKLDDATSFEVVHRLRIIDGVSEQPIYKNNCYNGYPQYVKASRAASALPALTDEQRTARNNAFTEASEALRSSGVKPGIAIEDKNLQLMPVFTVGK